VTNLVYSSVVDVSDQPMSSLLLWPCELYYILHPVKSLALCL